MRFTRSIVPAYVALLATLAAGGLGLRAAMRSLDVYLRKEPVPLRADLGSIPTALGRWQKLGDDQLMDAAMVESLGTDKYLTRTYALDGDASKGVMTLHLAYYTGMIDTVPHIPERCWGAGGLVQVGEPTKLALDLPGTRSIPDAGPRNAATGEPYPVAEVTDPVTRVTDRVALPLGEPAMTLTTFQDRKASRIEQLGGYFFIANGRCTPTTFGVRGLAFNMSDRYAYYCKVQLSARYPVGDTPSSVAFKAQAEDFLTQLLPHLMRRLPDWPAVERRSRGGN
jgi:Protein of unknown function (DUF3485)